MALSDEERILTYACSIFVVGWTIAMVSGRAYLYPLAMGAYHCQDMCMKDGVTPGVLTIIRGTMST